MEDVIEKYVGLDGKPYATITLGSGDTESHIQLPSGYYLIRDREGSQTERFDACTTYITNQSGSALPSTGGPGTQWFYLIGLCFILGAAGIKRFSGHA